MMFLPFVLGSALAASPATSAGTPKAFMERLYASYRSANFSPFTHPERIFAPRLLSAINEDSKLAHGEVGYLDGDPICQCQDTSGMHPVVTGVAQSAPDKATVGVSIGWKNDKPTNAKFSLVRTRGGWRIADVSSSDEPSLVRALESSNRKQRGRH
jgi:hypothetical protein